MLISTEKETPERGFFSFTFEKNFEKILVNLNIKFDSHIMLAVSGGVDSMVLVTAVAKILADKSDNNKFCTVLTVNHNLREQLLTAGDSRLVCDYCKNTLHIPCILKTVPRGYIKKLSEQRGRGEEEAARYERYHLFKEVANSLGESNKQVIILTAHHRNDLLETVVMRFLQGSSATGPQLMRKEENLLFAKPLLGCTREEIEQYALENAIPFREDASNADISYLRNRMRHQVLPVLDTVYPGWDTAVVRGDVKQGEMLDVIIKLATSLQWQVHTSNVYADFELFKSAMPAVQIQMLYNGLDLLNSGKRVAYDQLHLAANNARKCIKKNTKGFEKKIFAFANGIEIGYSKNNIYIKSICDFVTESGFFVIIKDCGAFTVDGGIINVQMVQKSEKDAEIQNKNGINIYDEWSVLCTLPFIVKGIKLKNATTKITVKNLEINSTPIKNKVVFRFIRIPKNEF